MIFIQGSIILLAIALAWTMKVPCQKFNFYGTSIKEDKEFHRASFVIKLLLAFVLSLFHRHDILIIVDVVLLGLWLWLVFDIAIAIMLYGWKNWGYIGKTAKYDKFFRGLFKNNEGKIKALICVVLIAAINYFFY